MSIELSCLSNRITTPNQVFQFQIVQIQTLKKIKNGRRLIYDKINDSLFFRYEVCFTHDSFKPYDFLPLKYPILPEKSETIAICNYL